MRSELRHGAKMTSRCAVNRLDTCRNGELQGIFGDELGRSTRRKAIEILFAHVAHDFKRRTVSAGCRCDHGERLTVGQPFTDGKRLHTVGHSAVHRRAYFQECRSFLQFRNAPLERRELPQCCGHVSRTLPIHAHVFRPPAKRCAV